MFTRPQSASSRKLSLALEGDGQCHVSQRQAPAGAGLTMTALQGQCWEKPKPLAAPRDAVWGKRISSVTLLPNRRNQNFSRGDIRDSTEWSLRLPEHQGHEGQGKAEDE